MSIAALVIAIVALVIAQKAQGECALLKERLERLDSKGSDLDGEQITDDIQTNRGFIARLAGGESLDPEQVLEGRTWGDVNQTRAIELLNAGVRVLDVRTPQEILPGVIPGAMVIPVDELPMRFAEIGRPNVPTLVYCAAGVRSVAACEFLSRQGFTALHNLEAGFGAWSGPTEKPDE